jgi:hypothetical protein
LCEPWFYITENAFIGDFLGAGAKLDYFDFCIALLFADHRDKYHLILAFCKSYEKLMTGLQIIIIPKKNFRSRKHTTLFLLLVNTLCQKFSQEERTA